MSPYQTVEIGEIADVKGGKRLPKGITLQTTPNTHPYIRVRDFGSQTLELNSQYEYVDDETQKQIAQYIVSQGDVILSIVGTIGLVAIVGASLDGANLTENCVKITGLNDVDAAYLYYFLTSSQGQDAIKERTVGAVQAKLPIKNIRSLPIPFPDHAYRRAVVQVLESIDNKIAANQRTNDYLLELATAQFESALQAERREVRFGDIVELEDSKRIPLNSRDREQRKGPYPYYGATSIMDYVDDYLFDGVRILLGEDGSVITDDGYPVLQYVWGKYWVNNHAHILKPCAEYPMEMLYVALRRTAIPHIVTGAVQKKISQKNLNSLMLEMPNPEDVKGLEDLFSLYRNNINENMKLESLRDSLLPKLMSGELDVSAIIESNYE